MVNSYIAKKDLESFSPASNSLRTTVISGSIGPESFRRARSTNRDKLKAAVREEIDRALKDGFTADEVAKDKAGYLQSRQLSRAKDRELASSLANALFAGRTLTYDAQLEQKIAALSLSGDRSRPAASPRLEQNERGESWRLREEDAADGRAVSGLHGGTVFHVVAFGQAAGGETGGRPGRKGRLNVDSDGKQSVGQVEPAALSMTLRD